MSRIGKKPIDIPEKTEVSFDGKVFSVKGPLGELKREIHPKISVEISDNQINLSPVNQKPLTVALWGTFASHIYNMISGVNQPFAKDLVVEGVGFKSEVQGSKLTLNVGFSHPVVMEIPEGLTVTAEKNNIKISGIDKEAVGSFAARIRASKKPEPYKGKGIRYADEVIRRKTGKKTA